MISIRGPKRLHHRRDPTFGRTAVVTHAGARWPGLDPKGAFLVHVKDLGSDSEKNRSLWSTQACTHAKRARTSGEPSSFQLRASASAASGVGEMFSMAACGLMSRSTLSRVGALVPRWDIIQRIYKGYIKASKTLNTLR